MGIEKAVRDGGKKKKMTRGRLKQAAEGISRAQLLCVICDSYRSYVTSPTPVPIWGIAVIVALPCRRDGIIIDAAWREAQHLIGAP